MKRIVLAMVVVGIAALAASVARAHQGHSMQEPWHACEHAQLGDACRWSDAHDAVYIGTCREVAKQLLCVRNKPIERGSADHVPHEHADSDPHEPHARAQLQAWQGVALASAGLGGLCLLGLRVRRRA